MKRLPFVSWELGVGTKGQVCLSGGTGPKAAASPRTKDILSYTQLGTFTTELILPSLVSALPPIRLCLGPLAL